MPPGFSRSTRDNVTFIATLVNVVATALIALFAYLVSSDIRDIQKQADKRARAKEVQEFWAEMHSVDRKVDEQSRKLGADLAKFTIASGQLLDEYAHIYRNGSFETMKYDLKYLAAYATYLGAHGEASTAISSVGNEYAFLRIRYSSLASTHSVAGWALFANQDPAVTKWSNGAKSSVDRIAHSIHDMLTNQKNPNVIALQLTEGFSQLSMYFGTEPIPYAAGLSQFLDANWKNQVGNVRAQ